jgi:cell fate regulator YaaT (PSP1 superfamily)
MVTHLHVAEVPHSGSGGCGSCGGDSGERCGNGLEKIYPTTGIRFGFMKHIGEFTHAEGMKFGCGVKVVIKTQRGIEIGEQVSLTCSGCDKSVTRQQIQTYIENCGPEFYELDSGRILREATPDDLREEAHLRADAMQKRKFCRSLAERMDLPIKVIECEHLFGGERIIFYFRAEQRVDFRSLVKELASEYHTRIEMRQVGVRDEARLVADYETCGRECCCKVFLKTLRPVSMKMAKMQKATLDPSKVSGRCGRLKCCLRYEHVGYEELDRLLPPIGVRISTMHGDGTVVNRQILTQLVQLQQEDGRLITVAIEDVLKGDDDPRRAELAQSKPVPAPPREPGGGGRPATRPREREQRIDDSREPSPAAQEDRGTDPSRPLGGGGRRRRRRRGRPGPPSDRPDGAAPGSPGG